MRTKVEKLFCDGRRNTETTGGVLAINDEEVDGVRLKNMRQMLAYDVAARRAKDVADKENIHLVSLSRPGHKNRKGTASAGPTSGFS